MNLRIPLILKIQAPLILIISITVGIVGYRVYRESTNRWQSEMDLRLKRVVEIISDNIDIDRLALLQQPNDTNTILYEQLESQLYQALNTSNITWIGVYYKQEDFFYLWLDTDYTGVGYPFFYATPEHYAAYDHADVQRVRYTDEFGQYYGFVSPVVVEDEGGNTHSIALVEAVLDKESTELLERDTLNRVLPLLIVGTLGAIISSILVTVFTFNMPLHQVQRGAAKLAKGNFGHTLDMRSNDELGDLVDSFNEMSLKMEQLYLERSNSERIQHELEIAHNVQQALFPSQLPQFDRIQVATSCIPHRETSGDFYDIVTMGDGQVGVIIGDVSGKSIPAAMLMVSTHSTLRMELYNHDTPAQVLNHANDILYSSVPRGMFSAVCHAIINSQSHEIVWANAGQIYPLMIHANADAQLGLGAYMENHQRYTHLETNGMSLPLGIVNKGEYQDHRRILMHGDMVLFYTDGVIEAMNAQREMYGFEQLELLVNSLPEEALTPQRIIDEVLSDIARFTGQEEQHDDITLVAVKIA